MSMRYICEINDRGRCANDKVVISFEKKLKCYLLESVVKNCIKQSRKFKDKKFVGTTKLETKTIYEVISSGVDVCW